MCPGECLVYDRGELCNKVVDILNSNFGARIRVTSAGRPQGNGQAEAYVGSLKNKMYALMVEAGVDRMPDNWDETLLYRALQIVRSDPATATGYSPMELMLGRKPVWPIQLAKKDIDLEGTDLTAPLVDALDKIHNAAFGKAATRIAKEQERYLLSY